MEIGVYLTKAAEDAFDSMLAPEGWLDQSAKKKVAKIVAALRDRHSNAPKYSEKVGITSGVLTVDTLARVLGESMFGNKKSTRDAYADFSKLYAATFAWQAKAKFVPSNPKDVEVGQKVEHETFGLGTVLHIEDNYRSGRLARIKFDESGIRNIDLSFMKVRVVSAPGQAATEDAKNVAFGISDELSKVLAKTEHPVARALIDLSRGRLSPGQNVMGIRTLDVDKARPEMFWATKVDGKRSAVPVFTLAKTYLGGRFDGLSIDKFSREYARVVSLAGHKPGEAIRPPKFEFKPKDVRRTFISLVTETYPRGHEDEVAKFLGPGLTRDRHGNYFKVVGSSPDVMFASHLDTVSTKSKVSLVSRKKDDDEIISSDGTTILGADDKAGVTVMLYMMAHGVPGVYYFFVAEETGGVGSSKVAAEFAATPHLRPVRKCVSFDRKNYFSVITQQMYQDCCSEEFAKALCGQFRALGLSMDPDPTGVFTDSANFVEVVPECTNVSVGYFNEHTRTEALNVSFLERLAKACTKVDWAALPVGRSTGEDPMLYRHWGDVISDMREAGFYNEVKYRGDKDKLVISLALDTTSFTEIHTDIQNVDYVLGKLNLDAEVTFDYDLIKFQVKA